MCTVLYVMAARHHATTPYVSTSAPDNNKFVASRKYAATSSKKLWQATTLVLVAMGISRSCVSHTRAKGQHPAQKETNDHTLTPQYHAGVVFAPDQSDTTGIVAFDLGEKILKYYFHHAKTALFGRC